MKRKEKKMIGKCYIPSIMITITLVTHLSEPLSLFTAHLALLAALLLSPHSRFIPGEEAILVKLREERG
jgi:hypothetical protein